MVYNSFISAIPNEWKREIRNQTIEQSELNEPHDDRLHNFFKHKKFLNYVTLLLYVVIPLLCQKQINNSNGKMICHYNYRMTKYGGLVLINIHCWS